MNNRKDPPCQGILDLDRENLCVVDGVVFEKDSFQRYIREEHRPHPKKTNDHIQTGAQTAETAAPPTSSVCSAGSFGSFPLSYASGPVSYSAGSMPKFSSFSGISSAGSAFLKGGYGIDLI
ncbi:MAG: hypothetical protein IJ452_08325 [Butyricicoccus sp.]|nr:hypothetical protein [Butyricicoccus sp.]MBQ8586270.1 hypothetical protein [Butyricicoccus sp.]